MYVIIERGIEMSHVGARIKQIRNAKKLSLRELGRLAHVSHSFIADIESGRSNPSLDTLASIANALGVPIEQLVSSKEDDFVAKAQITYGYRGRKQAEELLENIRTLFDGGELPEEDKDEFFRAITEIYFESKERNKKYTPKKYRKNIDSQ